LLWICLALPTRSVESVHATNRRGYLSRYYYHKEVWAPILLYDDWKMNAVRVVVLLLGAVFNNIINRLWAMAVHYVMHENKFLYKHVHKRHHCPIRDLCATSAWQDTALEFFCMEVGTAII
jgi:sterol desaturase/sphingolipid hydroxylase (fatty acid hydroxylase superfamily)